MSSKIQTLKLRSAEKKENAARAFTSWQAFKNWAQVHDTALDQHGHRPSGPTWSNEDLDPTPAEKRTWRWWNFVVFYWGLSFGNWTLGSTMIGIGLNWWQAIIAIFLSQLISSIAMFFNSRGASVYHVGYPIIARSVFGMWGSYYFVAARAALAIIWFGVQCKFSMTLQSASISRADSVQCTLAPHYWRTCFAQSLAIITPIFRTTSPHQWVSLRLECLPFSFSGSFICL